MILKKAILTTLLGLFPLFVACGMDETMRPGEAENAGNDALTFATPEQLAAGEVVPGSYIVAFRAQPGSTRRRFASFLTEARFHYSYLQDRFLTDSRVKEIQVIHTIDLANPRDPAAVEDFAPPRALRLAWDQNSLDELPALLARVDFRDAEASAEVLDEWHAAGDLWFAEPNHLNYLHQNPYTQEVVETYTTLGQTWHKAIKLPEALKKLSEMSITSAQAPVIAVLDSGVDVQNPALQGRIWENPLPGESGCPNDVYGCDTTRAVKGVLGSGAVNPYLTNAHGEACPYANAAPGSPEEGEHGVCKHGTHVAGIIAAKAGDGIGGVCPVCRIMVIKIIKSIGGRGAAPDDAILAGFKYLTLFGTSQKVVRVANSSFGKYVRARSVALLVSVLKKKPMELLVVGAAGNEDSMARSYPAALNDAIAVASVSHTGAKAYYSNFGPWVDVAAPGGDTAPGYRCSSAAECIDSTIPGTSPSHDLSKGTSMAAPVVAGVAGLILSIDPTRSFTALRSSIINSADCRIYLEEVNDGINRRVYYPKVASENTRRPLLGSGIVDAAAALDNAARSDCSGATLQRVTRNCGVVGTGGHGPWSGPWSGLGLLLLGLPILVLAVRCA